MIGATALPAGVAAEGVTYRRYKMSDPNPQPHVLKALESYKTAIRKMLELPPSDPRNWYRNALVHTFDCPHGNWWFLPWHRAYLGYFERTCRQLSGDPEFALPYWDWTEDPRIPAVMFNDVLDPSNDAYIETFEEFKKAFEVQLAKMWASFSTSQKEQLEHRGYKSVAHFWLQELYEDPDSDLSLKKMFPAPGVAKRKKTVDLPDFDPKEKTTVSLGTIEEALRTATFARDPFKDQTRVEAAGFGSTKAPHHDHGGHRQGLLESQPHNNVHSAVGGFMDDFLSPVDPIFFLHHANIDRLWDVWTRRQEAPPAQPALPEASGDLSWWQEEPFLFFSDENGQPVSNATVENYRAMSFFNYDYEPGKGEHMVPLVPKVIAQAPSADLKTQSFSAVIRTKGEAGGVVEVPGELLQPGSVTTVTLNLRRADRGRRFQVVASAPGHAPIVAGMITVFGPLTGETSYTVPVPIFPTAEPETKVEVKFDVVPLDEIEEPEKPSFGSEAKPPFAPGENPSFAPGPVEGGPQFKVPKGNAPQVTAIQVMKNN